MIELAGIIRLALTGLAVLITAGASLAAGTTTTGLLVRVALAGLGFWAVGTGLGKLAGWALAEPTVEEPVADEGPEQPAVRGAQLDVLLPAATPDPDEA